MTTLGCWIASVLLVGITAARAAEPLAVKLVPHDLTPLQDAKRVLVNPHKGWYHHFPDNHPNKYQIARDADLLEFPGMDHLYIRLAWAYLEPKEGQFDWPVIDRLIEKWTAHGLGIAFRISCKETSTDRIEQQFATPRWVMEAGAKGGHYRAGKEVGPDGPWEPAFDDPIFLAKLDRFLAAFATRYDGKPWLRYVDIGSIGDWGEGHTWAGSRKTLSFAVRKEHVDLYLKHFKRSQLVISDDFVYALSNPTERAAFHQHVLTNGISYRDDSIMVNGYFAGTSDTFTVRSPEFFADAYRLTPTVLELEHYRNVKGPGNWEGRPDSSVARFGKGKKGPDFFRGALGLLHATYIGYHGDARDWLTDNPELTKELLNKCGYWLFPKSLELPDKLMAGATVPLTLTIENRGVAPPYVPYELRLKLSGAGGRVIKVLGAGGKSWLPGAPVASKYELSLPADLKPDEYKLAIGLFDRSGSQERPVEFGLKALLRDSEGFYELTKVPVTAAQASDSKSIGTSVQNGWVTVAPPEFHGAINNPLKGFRNYKKDGYGLLNRQYIKWNDIEVCADDSVERIIAHTNKITAVKGKRFEDLNVKLVPRVYLDWDGSAGKQYWPADLNKFDYDSPAFQERLRRLVAKLGEAWDEDPRIFAVQMGLIGRWGEHHNPAPTAEQRRLLTEAFQKAFKNKPVLVRHNDAEFMQAGFGIYYDTFANISREPPTKAEDQFPWQATHVYRDIWKRAPIEGEVEYNWQKQRESAKPAETFGRTPDETMTVPAYRRYMVDKIRRYHASSLGWISGYNTADREVLAGAAELQKAFGYRLVLESASYPLAVQPGGKLAVKLTVRNTGSAPFYLDWPVAVALLDPATKKAVWSAPLAGVDIRRWLPGEDWDSAAFAYRRPAVPYHDEGRATLPADLKPGKYLLALAILDRQGGMLPSVRFAIENYIRGGWHPLSLIGVGDVPEEAALRNVKYDSPAFDDSLHYTVPEKLLSVKAPPLPQVKAVTPWTPDPRTQLINPWRYWILKTRSNALEEQILSDGPVATRQYRPQLLTRIGNLDLNALTANVAEDIAIAREWKSR
jgi:hypothetical protein